MDLLDRMAATGRRVAVLGGGTGSEREVARVSAGAVAAALGRLGLPCDLFDLRANALPAGLDPAVHVVLPLVHGAYGEDGRLSADLDRAGFAYAGCDQAASVLCFDKYACKAVAARLGIPVAADRLLSPGRPVAHAELQARLGSPYILKPRRDGSSVGLHLVRTEEDHAAARDDLAASAYLAERYIAGCDLTVGILDGEALGVVAVHPQGGLYDYRHKYTAGLSRYEAPAAIGAELAARLRGHAVAAFAACGCRDFARVDFRLGDDGSLAFLEINTLPGMTPTSLLPMSAGCMGIGFDQLVARLVGCALGRAGDAAAP